MHTGSDDRAPADWRRRCQDGPKTFEAKPNACVPLSSVGRAQWDNCERTFEQRLSRRLKCGGPRRGPTQTSYRVSLYKPWRGQGSKWESRPNRPWHRARCPEI